MSDHKTLSPWEVDALLSAFSAEPARGVPTPVATLDARTVRALPARPASARPVKNYDFRRPDKFSRGQMRSLQLLHENFARLLGTGLSTLLRMAVPVHVATVEQTTYGEYSEQLPTPTVLYLLSLDPLAGRVVMGMNVQLSYAIMDRLLGGPGVAAAPRQTRENTDLSDIEMCLLLGLTDQIANAFRETWASVTPVEPTIHDTVLRAELAQAAMPNEVCVVVVLEVRMNNSTGTISICLPYAVLEQVVGRLSLQAMVAGSFRNSRRDDPQARERTIRQLERVELPVAVRLGSAAVSVRDVMNLEIGDVICLDSSASGTLTMMIDGEARYRVRPGLTGSHLAVRVEHVLEAESGPTAALAVSQGLEGQHERIARR